MTGSVLSEMGDLDAKPTIGQANRSNLACSSSSTPSHWSTSATFFFHYAIFSMQSLFSFMSGWSQPVVAPFIKDCVIWLTAKRDEI
jgi:hypothetical protein